LSASVVISRSRNLLNAFVSIAALIFLSIPIVVAQQALPPHSDEVTIQGTVHDSVNRPVGDALVRLEQDGTPNVMEVKTGATGVFVFSALRTGSYTLHGEKSGLRSPATAVVVPFQGDRKQIDLVLEDSGVSSQSSAQAIEFADKPNFTVAGVTDWTAVGGHGSDSILRTSEDLSRETLTLKQEASRQKDEGSAGNVSDSDKSESKLRAALASAPKSFQANHQLGEFYFREGNYCDSVPLLQASYQIDPTNRDNEYELALALKGADDFSRAREHIQKLLKHQEDANLHRVAGELDEKLGDPLAAVHEYEQAVRLDPNEQNYFEWGSELLLHRAVWQAQEVFRKGTEAYPKSARMLTALGTALFASALYDEAALRLCDASDLEPADSEPYIFMGRIEMVAPNPMACVEQKLARFVQEQPENSLANYFYAMAIWKRQQQSIDQQALRQVEALLTKAVTIDAKCSDADLQLGILYFSQHSFEKAINFYTKAIEANPQFGEAHYRLGVAYDRIGDPAKAKQEFQLHDEIEKTQADAVEQQRREVKQFQVVLQGQPNYSQPH
jgi:tetratricopeptide (TPR) repeat protein